MFNFLKKSSLPHTRPERVIKVIERELGSLTLGEWCQDKSLCTQSQNVLLSPIVRQMIQVLHNSHPAFQVMTLADTNARAIQQARCEGYTMCLADFESMGHYAVATENIEAEFGVEEISETELAPYKSGGKRIA